MATTNPDVDVDADPTARQRAARWVLGVLVLGAGVWLVLSFRTPPQMGPSEDVFNTVDALYTAVRNHDDGQLTRCEQRLAGYRAAGKLPAEPADYLDGVIGKAKSGEWDAAARRLYDFMLAQRREGELDHAPKPAKTTPKGAGKR